MRYYIEEHLGVGNRNHMRVDLFGTGPLYPEQVLALSLNLKIKLVIYMTIRVVPRTFRPFHGDERFFILYKLSNNINNDYKEELT